LSLLEIKNLIVSVSDNAKRKEILHGVNLHVNENEIVTLLGPNGSGKSTVASAVAGMSKFKIDAGEVMFDGERIDKLSPDKRARKGLFLSHQNPIEIPGISTSEMLYNAFRERDPNFSTEEVQTKIFECAKKLDMDIWFADHELNVGFSGGEKKKNEVLQMMVLGPKLAILDEIDSGLDVDASKIIMKALMDLQKETGMSLLIITHNMRVLPEIKVNRVYIMKGGNVVMEGDAKLQKKVAEIGFNELLKGVK
jgi:Fe-S cluster assembly ATP-binding protein